MDGRLKQQYRGANGLLLRPNLAVEAYMNEINRRLDGLYRLLGRETASISYINYQGSPMQDWEVAYFGGNAPRLAVIKAKYDPLRLFSKPYVVDNALGASTVNN